MDSETQEKVTQHLLTLICISAFMLFLYALIEHAYDANVSSALLGSLFSDYGV